MTPELWRAYRQPMADEQMMSHFGAGVIAAIVETLPPADSVLCVGCGDGTELRYFPNARGVTLNGAGVLPEYRPRVLVADMHCLPLRDKSVGGVFCKDTFEHALAPTIAFSEFSRVARDWIFLAVPDPGWAYSAHHTIIPTDWQVGVMAEKAGWRVQTGVLACKQEADPPRTWTLSLYLMRPERANS